MQSRRNVTDDEQATTPFGLKYQEFGYVKEEQKKLDQMAESYQTKFARLKRDY